MDKLPKRKRIRLENYDYTQNGYYFVTICTYNREKILSVINDNEITLYPIGEIIEQELKLLESKYNIEISPYVIMPDHIHAIIRIEREEQSPSPTLINIICALKSITTRKANNYYSVKGRKIWQRSYYEHIIRNERDYIETFEYIKYNALKNSL